MVLGVTGKTASGKTVVMRFLEQLGFCCICTDEIVHKLYEKAGKGSKAIEKVFGGDFIKANGEVDRTRLRNLVFADKKQLVLLNKIIHPLVYSKLEEMLKTCISKSIAIESVYFDKGLLSEFVDKILWVERDNAEILKVLVGERKFSNLMAKKVIESIKPPKEVDFFVVNNGTVDDLNDSLALLVSKQNRNVLCFTK